MANKHYEICSVSFVIRKLKIKTDLVAQLVKKDKGGPKTNLNSFETIYWVNLS